MTGSVDKKLTLAQFLDRVEKQFPVYIYQIKRPRESRYIIPKRIWEHKDFSDVLFVAVGTFGESLDLKNYNKTWVAEDVVWKEG